MIPATPPVRAPIAADPRFEPRTDASKGTDRFSDALGRIGHPATPNRPEPREKPGKERIDSAQESPKQAEAQEIPATDTPVVEAEDGAPDAEGRTPKAQDAKGDLREGAGVERRDQTVPPTAEGKATVRTDAAPTLPKPVQQTPPPPTTPPTVQPEGVTPANPSQTGVITGDEDAGDTTGGAASDDTPIKTPRDPKNPHTGRGFAEWTPRRPGAPVDQNRGQPVLVSDQVVQPNSGEAHGGRSAEPPVATGEGTPRPPVNTGRADGVQGAQVSPPGAPAADSGGAGAQDFHQGDQQGSRAQTKPESAPVARTVTPAPGTAPEAQAAPIADKANPVAPLGVEGLGTPRVGGAQKSSGAGAESAARSAQQGAQAGFEGAVSRGFSAVMRQNGGSVVIRLIPETLGPLRISMSVDKSTVSVSLQAATVQAHELLTNNLGSLRQSLEAQGLRVERMGVTLAHASHATGSADGASASRGSEDPGAGDQDATGGRSRGHSDQSSRDRRGGAHADPTPTFASFSELIDSPGTPMRLFATA